MKVRAVLIVLLALAVASCGSDPETAKRRHLDRGNDYFAKQKYAEATVEYRNAIQVDPRFGEAHLRLAQAYARLQQHADALREYVRAAELLPARTDVQLSAGRYLLAARRFDEARAHADRVLQHQPGNAEAVMLRANALAGSGNITAATAELDRAVRTNRGDTRLYTTLGGFEMALGHPRQAEAAFTRAVEIDPRSSAASLALGSFYWASNRLREAEEWLRNAVRLDPRSADANRAMGNFCAAAGRTAEAGPYFEAAAASTPDPEAKVGLAEFYARTGATDRALALLTRLRSEARLDAQGRARLAALYYDIGRHGDAYAIIDDLIAHGPRTSGPLIVKGRFLIADGKADQAAQAFTEAATLSPKDAGIQMELARLSLAGGRGDAAIRYATDATRLQPDDPGAHLLLARALATAGDTERAKREVDSIASRSSRSAPLQVEIGSLNAALGRIDAARAAYDHALALDPSSSAAVDGLVTLDLGQKRGADAVRRADALVSRRPDDARALLLQARTYAATGNLAASERAATRALQVDPNNVSAYDLLARVYLAQGRLDAALQRFEQVAQKESKPAVAETMIGVILQAGHRDAEAEQHFARAVALDPGAAVAANNLAWLYADDPARLDQALALAQQARAQLPDRPEVNDTLGWVYYRKGLGNLAVEALEHCVDEQPANPQYRYHLGLAYLKTDQKARAREAFSEALRLNRSFPGADDARSRLAELSAGGSE